MTSNSKCPSITRVLKTEEFQILSPFSFRIRSSVLAFLTLPNSWKEQSALAVSTVPGSCMPSESRSHASITNATGTSLLCHQSDDILSASNLFGKPPLWIPNILPELFFGFEQLFGNGPQTPTDTGLKACRTVQTQQRTVKVPIPPPSTPACIPPQGLKFNEHTIYLLEDRASSPVFPSS